MRRSPSYAAALLVVAIGLTGCGGGGDHPTLRTDLCIGAVAADSGIGADPSCNDATWSANGPVVVAGATRGGNVVVLTEDGLHGSLDPSAASAGDVVSILSGLVTRSLTQYRYDPTTRGMILVPDIATDLGMHNEAYTLWKFQVRGGVRFEDGSPVTAASVVQGVRRCLRGRRFPSSPCLGAPIRSVAARGKVITFHMSAPYPELPYLAALPALGPMPPGHAADPATYARHPLATGPYRIARYRRGHRLVLVRNPQWDTRTDPARTQYPDRYAFRSGVSDARIARLLRHDRGTARTTLTYDTLHVGPFRRSRTDGRLVFGPTPCTTYLAPDNRTIRDPAVRRALIWAYPYRKVLRIRGLTVGVTAVPATNLLPPGIPGRTPIKVHAHDGFATQPGIARRMLARAHALGTRVRFPFSPRDRTSLRVRDALARSLRASGFDPRPTPASGPVDLRTTTRCGAWPSGGQWLAPVYGSTQPSPPGVERGLRRVARLPLSQQGAAWNKLDHVVLQRSQPVVPIWYAGAAMAHGSRIKGMADDTVRGMPTWQRVWIGTGS
jgi:peptide/nickel transport system substrate-binding protein